MTRSFDPHSRPYNNSTKFCSPSAVNRTPTQLVRDRQASNDALHPGRYERRIAQQAVTPEQRREHERNYHREYDAARKQRKREYDAARRSRS
jgi:hypothetical protein